MDKKQEGYTFSVSLSLKIHEGCKKKNKRAAKAYADREHKRHMQAMFAEIDNESASMKHVLEYSDFDSRTKLATTRAASSSGKKVKPVVRMDKSWRKMGKASSYSYNDEIKY